MFRLAFVILGLAAIGLAVVHLQWSNAHLGYLIQTEYDRHQRLKAEYLRKRLELAGQRAPEHLIEQLRKFELPLEGWLTTQPKEKPAAKPGPARPRPRPPARAH